MILTEDIKRELFEFVLIRTSIRDFNIAIKKFNTQSLYARQKRTLKQAYPDLMPTDLYYSIVMCEVFKPYTCDEIECPKLLYQIDGIKKLLPTMKKVNINTWAKYVAKHDLLVTDYSKLLEPQNKLIKEFKKLRRKIKS